MYKNLKSTISYSFKASLPVMAGYLVLGTGFGILFQSKGYSWVWSLLMSVTVFAGSMQYVTIDLLASGASLVTAALMTLMVNIRHMFYGITMIGKYKNVGPTKPYLIFALTDETFSLVCSPSLPESVDKKGYYIVLSLLNHFYWIIGSVLGGIFGNAVNFNSAGIEFSMTALFVVIFVEQWEKAENHLPAITGLIISVICLLVFGSSGFLIPSMIAITIVLFIEKRWINGGDKK